MPRQILFLCTGNYYRSRFAEEIFNHLAARARLDWIAVSRGFAPDPVGNIGPISPHTRAALAARGLQTAEPIRFPAALSDDDLRASDLIIALKEAEHRRMLVRQFPDWVDRVRYWHVHDLDRATGEQGTNLIERLVGELIESLI